jgi:hypothetical protein
VVRQVEQHVDHENDDRDHNEHPLPGSDLVFILSAPPDVVARRQPDALRDVVARLLDESADVTAADVE